METLHRSTFLGKSRYTKWGVKISHVKELFEPCWAVYFSPKGIGKNFEILTAKLEVTNVIFSDYPQRKPNILSMQKWTKVNQKLMVQPISLMTPDLGIASRSASGYICSITMGKNPFQKDSHTIHGIGIYLPIRLHLTFTRYFTIKSTKFR